MTGPDEKFNNKQLAKRGASAQLRDSNQIAPRAVMKEAMDPANKSLAEALQFSFRALQVVMVILVILYALSGFRSIEEGQGGLATRFGSIEGASLEPGLQANWPAPVGNFILFDIENRSRDLEFVFLPGAPRVTTLEELEQSSLGKDLAPGRDGFLLTSDGDMLHAGLLCGYEIEDPIAFARAIEDEKAGLILSKIVQQACILESLGRTTDDLLDMSNALFADLVISRSQKRLDNLELGIKLVKIEMTKRLQFPTSIQQIRSTVDERKELVKEGLQRAVRRANEQLLDVAGQDYEVILTYMDKYGEAWRNKNENMESEAQSDIDLFLESTKLAGEASRIIGTAKSYQSQIDLTLGNDFRQWSSLLPAWKENSDLVVAQRWLSIWGSVFDKPDVEILWIPEELKQLDIDIKGLDSVAQLRRDLLLKRKEESALLQDYGLNSPIIPRGREMILDGPGRRLRIQNGNVVGGSE